MTRAAQRPRVRFNKKRLRVIVDLGGTTRKHQCAGVREFDELRAFARGAPIPGFNPDINGDGTVNVTDLLAVISSWGVYGVEHLLAVIAAWGDVEVFYNPIDAFRQDEGVINLANFIIDNRDGDLFNGGYGIEALPGVESITLVDGIIHSYNYGIWCPPCPITLKRVKIYTHRGGNNYAVRGNPTRYRDEDCVFDTDDDDDGVGDNKGTHRIYGCTDFESRRSVYVGGKLMMGGGAVDNNNQLPFRGTYDGCSFDCDTIECYEKSVVDVIDTKLDGSGNITNWNGGESKWNHCTKNGVPISKSSAFKQNNGLVGVTILPP